MPALRVGRVLAVASVLVATCGVASAATMAGSPYPKPGVTLDDPNDTVAIEGRYNDDFDAFSKALAPFQQTNPDAIAWISGPVGGRPETGLALKSSPERLSLQASLVDLAARVAPRLRLSFAAPRTVSMADLARVKSAILKDQTGLRSAGMDVTSVWTNQADGVVVVTVNGGAATDVQADLNARYGAVVPIRVSGFTTNGRNLDVPDAAPGTSASRLPPHPRRA